MEIKLRCNGKYSFKLVGFFFTKYLPDTYTVSLLSVSLHLNKSTAIN